jgi:hypothetical protein
VDVAAAGLWRLDLSDDPLQSPVRVVEDKLDRLDALGSPATGRTAPVDQLIELVSQERVQKLHEPCGKATALTCREAQPRVFPEGQLNPSADHLTVAAGMGGPAVALLGQGRASWRTDLSSGPEADWV